MSGSLSPSQRIWSLNRGAGHAEIGCRRQARRALQTGRSANQILIVDEVLAVGDAEFQKKCLGKMKDVAGYGRTILFTSHIMQIV
jgi:ABC-type glutathione transport system ATPase component